MFSNCDRQVHRLYGRLLLPIITPIPMDVLANPTPPTAPRDALAPAAAARPVKMPEVAITVRAASDPDGQGAQVTISTAGQLLAGTAGSPQAVISQLETLRQHALDPQRPDPALAAAIARALQAAEAALRQEKIEEQRRQEAKRQLAEDAPRESSPPLALPVEALRPLGTADRLRRAAVEGAYLAGDLAPGGLRLSTFG